MKRTHPLLAAALVLVVLASLFFFGSEEPGDSAVEPIAAKGGAPSSAGPEALTTETSRELLLLDTSELEEAPGVTFLKAYYGADAEQVMQKVEAAGMDLATLLPPTPVAQMHAAMPHWFHLRPDQRQREYESEWGWPAEGATNQYLDGHFRLTRDLVPGELAALDALAASYEPDIHGAADRYFATLDAAMALKVAAQEYELSPYIAWPEKKELLEERRHFRATTKIGEGWVVRMALEVDRFPEVIAARDAVHGASYVRHRDIAETIRMMGE